MSRSDKRKQRGQALVELALIMPVLVLLIFGSLYIVYAFMQRSVMNGAAFMAARTVSVRNPDQVHHWATAAQVHFREKARLGKRHWLRKAKIEGKVGLVTLTEPDGVWPVVARAASIPAGERGWRQQIHVAMAPEYVRIGNYSGRPPTAAVIDYSVVEGEAFELLLQSNPFVRLFVDTDADRRIYKPDRHVLKRRDPGGGAGQGRGNLDDQLGAIYVENTHWLDHHKHELGITKGLPDVAGDQRPPQAKGGTLDDLERIGKVFTEVTQGAQTAIGLIGKFTTGPVGQIFVTVVGKVGGPVLEMAETHLGTVAKRLEERERQVLVP